MAVRTFLALDLDDAILDALAEACARLDDPKADANIRWVARQNLHITMAFLGDVPDEMVGPVCRAASEAAAMVRPFDFQVKGLSCVPPRGELRMIWAKVLDPSGKLGELHDVLAAALEPLHLCQEDRPFKPHLTLARIKFIRDAGVVRALAASSVETDFGLQHVTELVTYSSQLTAEGPVYTPMSRAALAC